jgi:hypothetical protein
MKAQRFGDCLGNAFYEKAMKLGSFENCRVRQGTVEPTVKRIEKSFASLLFVSLRF